MMKDIDRLLESVSRPTRYLGNEINSIHKDPSSCRVKVCLAFPDLYEIGMSHLGLKILYKVINDIPDALAHRVYAPSQDMADLMKEEGIPIFSLEGRIPLREFDIIGFTLQHELSYTNILWMLDLAGIPLRREDREEDDPLIVAGGPCAVNPEPLAPFIDLFCIGDGEGFIRDLVRCIMENRGKEREEILLEVSKIPGSYIPSLYEERYDEDGRFIRLIPKDPRVPFPIRSRIEMDLDILPFPTSQIVPFMQIVHDRAPLEAQRGCTRGCRFCQAGMIYRPTRERSIDCLKDQASRLVASTGYEEVSLLGLSISDYEGIEEFALWFIRRFGDKRIALSLPSLRPDGRALEITRLTSMIKKRGLTIAPEAGTIRLRRVINKEFDEETLLENIRRCFVEGFRLIKLYFMIGLPTEGKEDLDGVVDLVKRIEGLITHKGEVKVSISPFVPKPHTPFQWLPQLDIDTLKERGGYLFRRLKRLRRVRTELHSVEMSFLEGVIAKGDRRLADVIERAFLLGCRFDSWVDKFRFDLWIEAFEREGIDPSFYLHRKIGLTDPLPWDHIEIGVGKEYLVKEYIRAHNGEVTDDCRVGKCMDCGACRDLRARARRNLKGGVILRVDRPPDKDQRYRMRIEFSKKGTTRYLSHLDTISLFARAIRRAGIPVAFSQGYSPHPRLSFGPPLPVGMESRGEYADIGLGGWMDPEELKERLNGALPEGFDVRRACFISNREESLFSIIDLLIYRATLKGNGSFCPRKRISEFLKDKPSLIREMEVVEDMEDGVFVIELSMGGAKARVRELLEGIFPSCRILGLQRIAQFHIGKDNRLISPMEMGTRRKGCL